MIDWLNGDCYSNCFKLASSCYLDGYINVDTIAGSSSVLEAKIL